MCMGTLNRKLRVASYELPVTIASGVLRVTSCALWERLAVFGRRVAGSGSTGAVSERAGHETAEGA